MDKLSFLLICVAFIHVVGALSVEERLSEVERVLKIQTEKQEQIIRDQAAMIRFHEREKVDLKIRLKSLEEEIAELKDDKTLIKKSKNADSALVETLSETDQDSRAAEMPEFKADNNLKSLVRGQKRLAKRQSENIAFHAYVSGQICLHDHEVLVFNVKEIDTGNGYNNQDGIYTVPDTGYYVFTWTTIAIGREWFQSEIVVNGVKKGWSVADSGGGDDTEEITATGFVIANVSAGDHVFIRRTRGLGCTVRDAYAVTSFTGWKLFSN